MKKHKKGEPFPPEGAGFYFVQKRVVHSTKKAARRLLFRSDSDRDPVDRNLCVRMCYCWYTRCKDIRTRRAGIGKGFEREALVAFAVIDDKVEMIIEDVNGVDKSFDDAAAKQGVVPVSFGEPAEEKQDAVTGQKLGL